MLKPLKGNETMKLPLKLVITVAVVFIFSFFLSPAQILSTPGLDVSGKCYYEIEVKTEDTEWTLNSPCGSDIVQVYISYIYYNPGGSSGFTSSVDSFLLMHGVSVLEWNGIGTNSITITELDEIIDIGKIGFWYDCCPKPKPVRTHPLTCWQVFINGEGNFEFIFFWEYADNNWVKIYDMDGNLVYEIDFSYGKPRFEVDLPDGMYTVRTFHDGFENPIQEFLIGKP